MCRKSEKNLNQIINLTMKTINTIAMLMIVLSAFSQHNQWENPAIVEEGKEAARAYFVPVNNIGEPGKANLQESPNIQLLNGTWKFHFAEKVADRPLDFYQSVLNDQHWDDIQVPGSWETQGFGVPVYTNVPYIFPKNPPYVDNNDLPIGTYRKTFVLDEKLSGKEIILHFGSISGASIIYVNGQKVGYTKVAKVPAEFNITHFLKPGENQLSMQVFKWSDASYLEDQDFWRLGGIERDVFLIGRPKVSLEDFFVVADLDAKYVNGLLSMDVKIRNFSKEQTAKHSLVITMTDAAQKKIFTKTLAVKPIGPHANSTLSITEKVNNPEKWSAEAPNLYLITMELKDAAGTVTEAASVKTGFRKMEIINKQLLINGKPIVLKGTNLHEHHEKFGHYIDSETRLKDLQLMKQYNLNAIRTSHYPQAPEFYALCDEFGFYVIDEANIEAHGLDGMPHDQHPSFRDDWKGQHLDRTIRMFERDKNHPSVIIWSLGNESDFGPNYEATYNWLKENDKAKRPVQFERAYGNAFTDIFCPMYMKPHDVEQYAQNPDNNKPLILCEYVHSMGNSTGNFQEYWDIIMKYPILQGGFIWDWVDQGLEAYNFEGKKYWLYGGDLGGYRWTHDENFCNNGLINPDRTIHPALNEVKKAYQPIWFKAIDIEKGIFSLQNHNLFTNLNAYDYAWKLLENGIQVAEGNFTVEGIPLATKEIKLSLPAINYEPGSEYFLVLEAQQRNASPLLKKGHVIASEQMAFPGNQYYVTNKAEGKLSVNKTERELKFTSGDVEGAINLRYGKLAWYRFKGKNLIHQPLDANFWRAPIDNDFGNNMPRRLNLWRAADQNMVLQSVDVKEQTAEGITVVTNFHLFDNATQYKVVYDIQNDGSVKITASFDMGKLDLPELPRFGMKTQLPGALENVQYYGRGPWENYSDRKNSAFIGQYASKVNELNFDYSRPQENGYRTDVRTVTFTNNEGFGLMIEGSSAPICFNAKYNTDEDFDPGLTKKQQHPIDVRKRHNIYLNIDYGQMGVGGNDSWGALPLDQYRLLNKQFQYSFILKPVQ